MYSDRQIFYTRVKSGNSAIVLYRIIVYLFEKIMGLTEQVRGGASKVIKELVKYKNKNNSIW